MKSLLVSLFIIILSFGCCNECCKLDIPCPECPNHCRQLSPINVSERKYLNINILLDMSDRIFDSNQKERDKKILELIYKNFTTIITKDGFKNSGFSFAKDKLSIQIASQKNIDNLKYQYESILNIDYSNIPQNQKASQHRKRETDFIKNVDLLYKEDIKPIGSDFSEWIYNMSGLGARDDFYNLLLIITDGEKDNFLSRINNFNLNMFEIVFLEISNDGNDVNEIIKKETIINNYFNETKYKSLKIYNNKTTVENVVRDIFLSFNNVPYEGVVSNGISSSRTKLSEYEESDILVDSEQYNHLLNYLNEKILNASNHCEQSLYIGIKSEFLALEGIPIKKNKLEEFKSRIDKVVDDCD